MLFSKHNDDHGFDDSIFHFSYGITFAMIFIWSFALTHIKNTGKPNEMCSYDKKLFYMFHTVFIFAHHEQYMEREREREKAKACFVIYISKK